MFFPSHFSDVNLFLFNVLFFIWKPAGGSMCQAHFPASRDVWHVYFYKHFSAIIIYLVRAREARRKIKSENSLHESENVSQSIILTRAWALKTNNANHGERCWLFKAKLVGGWWYENAIFRRDFHAMLCCALFIKNCFIWRESERGRRAILSSIKRNLSLLFVRWSE